MLMLLVERKLLVSSISRFDNLEQGEEAVWPRVGLPSCRLLSLPLAPILIESKGPGLAQLVPI